MLCRSCGSEVPTGARFCANCGSSQSLGGEERRIVTVLFADIVGFTSLAEKLDPEEAKHLVDSCFERLIRDITSFGGVIDKVLGDGLVALFGAPTAHEDDAERAVRAALRMQNSMRAMGENAPTSLELRVGINTGEVLVGGSKAGGDYTAMGDVMNTASRLESQAGPGEILVGHSTHLATFEAISYRPAGELQVKGRDGVVEAHVALAATRPPGVRTRRSTSFIGRDAELDLISGQARMAVAHHRAQLTMVLGESGMGKTRVAEEAASRIASLWGGWILEGRCVPYGEANVWWPFADVIRRSWHLDVDLTAEEAHEVITASLNSDTWAGDKYDNERLLQALMHILGFDTPLRGGDRLRNRNEVTYAVTTLLARLLADSPVVWILSDVHWAPEPVVQVLAAVLDELARNELVVLLTARSGEEPLVLASRCGFMRLHLEPLGQAAAAEMLEQLGVDLPQEAIAQIIDRSGGNPFFIEELAGLVLSRIQAGDTDVVDDLLAGRIDNMPATLRGLVAARLDQLSPRERSVLENAAVLGRSASVEALSIMSKETNGFESIDDEFEVLVRNEFLEHDGSRYTFSSDLVRDIAYGTITKADRARSHAGVATFLEGRFHPGDRSTTALVIASHYRSAALLAGELATVDPAGQKYITERALHWLGQAGEIALLAGEPSDAERLFDEALGLEPPLDAMPRLLYGRARATCERHDLQRSLADLASLDELIDPESVLAAQALVVRGDVDRKLNNYDSSTDLLTRAAARLDELDMQSERARALRLLGLNEMAAGRGDRAELALASSRDVAAKAGDLRAEAWAVQSLAFYAFSSGQVEHAGELLISARESFRATNDKAGLAWSQGIEAWVAFHNGEWDVARKLVEAILPETARRGDAWAEGVLLSLAASLELWSGDSKMAIELARRGRHVAERAEDLNLVTDARAIEGRALVSQGRVSEGTALLEEIYDVARAAGSHDMARLAFVVNAASAARVGDFDRAIKWAELYDGFDDDRAVLGESEALVSLALARLQRGNVRDAAQILRSSEYDGLGQRYALAVQALICATMRQSDEVERLASLVAGTGTYLDQVFALWAVALDRARRGDRLGAVEAIEMAKDILAVTDDRITPAFHRLLIALISGSDTEPAANKLRSFGINPAGWQMLFERVLATASTPD